MVSLRSLITSSSFLTIANAGQVVMYMCQTGNTGKAVPATLAMRVHYSNSFDGCTGESAFDAYSGPISAIEAFQRFCGWDGVQDYFCGDINLSLFDTSDNGLNIILDGIQVTLGAATSSTDYAGDSDAGKATCSGLEFTPGLNGVATVMTWENVAVTHCR